MAPRVQAFLFVRHMAATPAANLPSDQALKAGPLPWEHKSQTSQSPTDMTGAQALCACKALLQLMHIDSTFRYRF